MAWYEVSSGKGEGAIKNAIAIVSEVAPTAPLLVLYAILTISAIDFMGGLIVVTARYLGNKFVKPLQEKLRAEGKAEERSKWTEWNRRRLEAESKGIPFDEPPPPESP